MYFNHILISLYLIYIRHYVLLLPHSALIYWCIVFVFYKFVVFEFFCFNFVNFSYSFSSIMSFFRVRLLQLCRFFVFSFFKFVGFVFIFFSFAVFSLGMLVLAGYEKLYQIRYEVC